MTEQQADREIHAESNLASKVHSPEYLVVTPEAQAEGLELNAALQAAIDRAKSKGRPFKNDGDQSERVEEIIEERDAMVLKRADNALYEDKKMLVPSDFEVALAKRYLTKVRAKEQKPAVTPAELEQFFASAEYVHFKDLISRSFASNEMFLSQNERGGPGRISNADRAVQRHLVERLFFAEAYKYFFSYKNEQQRLKEVAQFVYLFKEGLRSNSINSHEIFAQRVEEYGAERRLPDAERARRAVAGLKGEWLRRLFGKVDCNLDDIRTQAILELSAAGKIKGDLGKYNPRGVVIESGPYSISFNEPAQGSDKYGYQTIFSEQYLDRESGQMRYRAPEQEINLIENLINLHLRERLGLLSYYRGYLAASQQSAEPLKALDTSLRVRGFVPDIDGAYHELSTPTASNECRAEYTAGRVIIQEAEAMEAAQAKRTAEWTAQEKAARANEKARERAAAENEHRAVLERQLIGHARNWFTAAILALDAAAAHRGISAVGRLFFADSKQRYDSALATRASAEELMATNERAMLEIVRKLGTKSKYAELFSTIKEVSDAEGKERQIPKELRFALFAAIQRALNGV